MWLLGSIFIITSLLVLYLKYRVVFTGEKCKGKISNGVQGVQTRLKRKDRFESK